MKLLLPSNFSMFFILLLASELALAQTTLPENEPIANYPNGISYQTGPGSNNETFGWDYRYGTKLAINGGPWRNFELLITNRPYGDLMVREWDPYNNIWTGWRKVLLEDSNGNYGIGTSNASEKLTINGSVKAKEIIVQENVGADFVFEKSYDLPKLFEVEDYIKSKQHLPGIPSAEKMKRDGVKIGELQMKLLQKIEELTLYVIELKKENQSLAEMNKLILEDLNKIRLNKNE